MDEDEIEEILGKLESEFSRGNYESVKYLGFWKVVKTAKIDKEVAEKFSARIGRIDRLLFESKVPLKWSFLMGTLIELVGVLVGLLFLYYGVTSTNLESTLFYVASVLVLMTALHPFSHAIAGWFFGIKFHFFFPNGPEKVLPTLKVDYSTYVKVSSKKRAIFHFAGPINSFLITLVIFIIALYDPNAQSDTRAILAFIWIVTTSSEIMPLILTKLGFPKILFADLRKTDSYRALREWKIEG